MKTRSRDEFALAFGMPSRSHGRWRQLSGLLLPANVSQRHDAQSGRDRRDWRDPLLGQIGVQTSEVNFSWTETVYRDPLPQDPYPPKWLDANGDGDADDWNLTPWDGGDIRAPIAYTVGTAVQVVVAKFSVDPPFSINLANATAIGAMSGADRFTSTSLAYNGAGDEITASMSGQSPGATTIAYWPDTPIDWRIEEVVGIGTTAVYPAGTTTHHIYYILSAPTGNFTLYHSLVDIGCRRAAGLSGVNHGAVAAAIFPEFAGLVVTRATDVLEGRPTPTLTYYDQWVCGNLTVGPLLATGDGQCGAWADFFIRTMHAVGIDPPGERITVYYNQNPNPFGAGAMMLVSNWSSPGLGRNPIVGLSATYPDLNLPMICPPPIHYIENNQNVWQYVWSFEDVSDQTGVQGQGPTADPASLFDFHFFVEVSGTYYDASYGTTYTSFGALETAAIDAYGLFFLPANVYPEIVESDIGVDLDCDTFVTNASVATFPLVTRANPAGNQLAFNGEDVQR